MHDCAPAGQKTCHYYIYRNILTRRRVKINMGNYYHSSFLHGQSVKRSGDQNDRSFDVQEYEDLAEASEDNEEDYDRYGYDDSSEPDERGVHSFVQYEPWTYVGCPFDTDKSSDQRDPHTDAIVIQVNGVCNNNGYSNASGAFGVFFHPDNDGYNRAMTLPVHERHTSQRAQLHACLKAIRLAQQIKNQNRTGKLSRHQKKSPLVRLRHIVIKTNSEYATKAMDDYIWKWESNGYINTKGGPVVNSDLFRAMHEGIVWLNDRGVHVDFWLVDGSGVEAANCLAQAGLKGWRAAESVEECEVNDCVCLR